MRGPRSARPAPISSPKLPDPPLPPPVQVFKGSVDPAETGEVSSKQDDGRCFDWQGAPALQTGAHTGEVGQEIVTGGLTLESARAACAEVAAPIEAQDLDRQSSLRESSGQSPHWQQHKSQQSLKRSHTDLALDICSGARGRYSVLVARQKLARQRSCPALRAPEAACSWPKNEEQQMTEEGDSGKAPVSPCSGVDTCHREMKGLRRSVDACREDQDVKRGSWQKRCCLDMLTPGLSQPLEVVGWLERHFRTEREAQEQRHAAILESLHDMLAGDAAAASTNSPDPDPNRDMDAHPAAPIVLPLTTAFGSMEPPERTSEGHLRHKFQASVFASDPQSSTSRAKYSAGSFASERLHCREPAARRGQVGLEGHNKDGSQTWHVSRLATPGMKHVSTTEFINEMLVDRGFQESVSGRRLSISSQSSSFMRTAWKRVRHCSRHAVETRWWDYTMGVIIFANVMNVGIEIQLSILSRDTLVVTVLEHLFLCVFLVDILVRMIAGGRRVLSDPWLQLDAVLVSLGVFSQWILGPVIGLAGDSGQDFLGQVLIMRVFRLVRLARSLRFLRLFQPLWKLVWSVIGSSGTVLSAALLLLGAMYILACVGVELIGTDSELLADEETGRVVARHFASIPTLMLTLIQFATCDSIGQIYFPLVSARPPLILYVVATLLVLPICLMNLVTAMIVDHSIQSSAHDAELERAKMRRRLKTLIPALRRIFKELDLDGDGEIDVDELELSRVAEAQELMKAADSRSLHNLFNALDCDGSGKIDQAEFVDGMCYLLLSKVPIENLQILQLLRAQTLDIGEMKEVLMPEKGCSNDAFETTPLGSVRASHDGSQKGTPRNVP